MQIGPFDLDKRILTIAEIGNNHEGDFETAKKLVAEAAEAGVDAVKFQTFRTEHYVSASAKERFDRLKKFELTQDQFRELADIAHKAGMLFISTPFDVVSAEFLGGVADAIKIASGDNNFYPLLERVANTGKPVIFSTGVSDIEQVRKTLDCIRKTWKSKGKDGDVAILHCVAAYPVPAEEASLASIGEIRKIFGETVGYSDHTEGIDAAFLAVAAGARIIEKHFTLDHNFSDFRDHQLSADPGELKLLVEKIREAEKMMGTNEKKDWRVREWKRCCDKTLNSSR